MIKKDFSINIPNEGRVLRARLTCSQKTIAELQQLVIIATGLHSHMDKDSQRNLAETYQKAGFSTLQFNFMGHGKQQNQSDGKLEALTLSSSVDDLKAVWNYAKSLSSLINTSNIAITANSYGALVSLLALEEKIISPESMALTAPFSLEKFKPWILPLGLIEKLLPNKVAQFLKLPISSPMLKDFLKNHTNAISKKNLLGNTAVHFFVGSKDKLSSHKDIKKWCKKFNAETPENIEFVDNIQAHYMVYEDVPHFEIPEVVWNDMKHRAIDFIKKTRLIRSR